MELIDNLEGFRQEALDITRAIQSTQKERHDAHIILDKDIEKGDLVLVYDKRHEKFLGKMQSMWTGPYMVLEVFGNGSLQLENLDG